MWKTLGRTLISKPLPIDAPAPDETHLKELAERLDLAARMRIGRSLSIREVNNPFYDLERFGLKFVASPRHADVLMVTGPVTQNMREALERTYAATPDPKWVVAVGDCAFDAGIFAGSYAGWRRFERHPRGSAYTRLPAIADVIVARSVGNHGARHQQKYRLVVIRGPRSNCKCALAHGQGNRRVKKIRSAPF